MNNSWKFCFYRFSSIVIGTFSAIITSELFLQSLSFGYQFYFRQMGPIPSKNKNEIRIMCLGESTTQIGFFNSYPSTLERRLKKKYPKKNIIVINEGVSGTNTREILKNLPQKIKKHNPHYIITMMGINDQWSFNSNITDNSSNPLDSSWKLLKFFSLLKVNLKFKNNYVSNTKENKIGRIPENTQEIVLLDSKGNEIVVRRNRVIHPHSGINDRNLYPFNRHKFSSLNGEVVKNGNELFKLKKYNEALIIFKSALKKYPQNYQILQQIMTNLHLGDVDQARKFIADYPMSGEEYISIINDIYFSIGWWVGDSIDTKKSALITLINDLTLKAIKLSPQNPEAYYLAFHSSKDRTIQIENLDKAIALKFSDSQAYLQRYILHIKTHEWEKGENFLIPYLFFIYDSVGSIMLTEYIKGLLLENSFQALQSAKYNLHVLKKLFPSPDIERLAIQNNNLIGILPNENRNNYTMAQPETTENYQKIVHFILEAGIIPLVMQYPRLEMAPLKANLSRLPERNFISNQENFEKILRRKKFEDVFIDSFGGNFGHFSPLGSELVADNVVVVLENLPSFQ